ATRGKLAPFDRIQFTPPQVQQLNHSPILTVDPTYLGPPELRPPNIDDPNFGLPNSNELTSKGGPGGGGGLGEGCCGGAGKDKGREIRDGKVGGMGGGPPRAGTNGTSPPECTYGPTPFFTAEAIKAKYKGIVILGFVVTADGRATNIVVVQGP